MYRQTRELPVLGILVTGLTCLISGWWNSNGQLLGLGAIGVSYILLRIAVVSRNELLLTQLANRSMAVAKPGALPDGKQRATVDESGG